MAKPAKPQVNIGQTVLYSDHQGRCQSGRILSIEAKWAPWAGSEQEPFITYCVEHPTYKNRRHYTSEVTP